MALIGSGTKVIPNVVSTATWRAVDMDQAFAAFAEQLGGIAWNGGQPLIYGGNLDATNFATGMALDSRYIAQNKHYRTLTFTTDRNPYSTTPVSTSSTLAYDMNVRRICFSVAGWSAAATMSGSVLVKVNNLTIATITPSTRTTTVTRQGVPSVTCVSGDWSLGKGSKIEVDFSGLTCAGFSFYDRHVTLIGYGDNLP